MQRYSRKIEAEKARALRAREEMEARGVFFTVGGVVVRWRRRRALAYCIPHGPPSAARLEPPAPAARARPASLSTYTCARARARARAPPATTSCLPEYSEYTVFGLYSLQATVFLYIHCI